MGEVARQSRGGEGEDVFLTLRQYPCLLYTSRRQTTKFNGVPYVVQRAAAAVFTESGMAEIQSNLDYYRRNAKVIADALDECGVWYCGGKNSQM